MKKNRKLILNEGVYDFYDAYDNSKSKTTDKILNYYIDKIRKYGKNSLTKAENEILKDANNGELNLDNPVYKKNNLTNDIEVDNKGNPIRIDSEKIYPGIPYLTSKGKGIQKKEIIQARCYWDIEDEHRTFYVYGGQKDENNPNGLVIWKSISSSGKPLGAFLVPKSELSMQPEQLWKNLSNKFDKGVILDKTTYSMFLEFDDLYHNNKKQNMDKINKLYDYLKKYAQKN